MAMGYSMMLPPRYVELYRPESRRSTTTTTTTTATTSAQPTESQNSTNNNTDGTRATSSPSSSSSNTIGISNDNNNNNKVRRTVQFNENNNEIYMIIRIPDEIVHDIWYSEWDIALFKRRHWIEDNDGVLVKPNKEKIKRSNVAVAPQSSSLPLIIRQQSIPIIPPYHHTNNNNNNKQQHNNKHQPYSRPSRYYVVHSLLLHQTSCRARGFQDPQGMSLISRALSKDDRKHAWKIANFVAQEVSISQQQEQEQLNSSSNSSKNNHVTSPSCTDTTEGASSLCWDYYLDYVHPYVQDPFLFLQKILGDLDD